MYQTHSNKVIVITKKNKNLNKFKSDAIITKIRGIGFRCGYSRLCTDYSI